MADANPTHSISRRLHSANSVLEDQTEPFNSSLAPAGTKISTGAKKGRDSSAPGLTGFVGLALVFAQVALVALIMREVVLETPAFRCIVYIATGAFVLHHFLPHRHRLPAFALLCVGVTTVILTGSPTSPHTDVALGLKRMAGILAVGVALIATSRLSIGFWWRVALLVAIGALVAACRIGAVDSGMLAIIWPVLAAMFMFRLMVYIYDLSTSAQPPSWKQSLAYFFLIPNASVPLFPVVDFRTFCQSHYNENALLTYQRGARWMGRGVIHLLLYHFVNLLLAISPDEVADGTDLIRFVVTNVFLYLKVSGLFHLCIGLLLLFGFNLPETNHRYFLASSFTDYWRRTNIYWRNFIMKVFYYPAYFKVKKFGQMNALILATLWSFFVTWALHLYQTWWLKGTTSWTWPDALFWSMLGLLVLGNSIWELKRGRRRMLTTGKYRAREALGVMIRTAATFTVITLLWSLWSTPTLTQWFHMWSLADRSTLGWGGATLLGIMGAAFFLEILPTLRLPPKAGPGAHDGLYRGKFFRESLQGIGVLAAVFAATFALSRIRLNSSASTLLVDARDVIKTLQTYGDRTQGQGAGYYENLTIADQANKQFWETMRRAPFEIGISGFRPAHPIAKLPFTEFLPNLHREVYGAEYFSSNSLGLRDREYAIQKPPGTVRIALLGSSHTMGYGLSDPDIFEPAVENRLNAEHGREGRFEIINAALPGLSPVTQPWIIHNRVAAFSPDIVVFVAHLIDFRWTGRDVAKCLRLNLPVQQAPLDQLVKARVTAHTNPSIALRRLVRYQTPLVAHYYQQIVQSCKLINALPVCVFLPVPNDLPLDRKKVGELKTLAESAGFVFIDLSDIFAGFKTRDLSIARDPAHHFNEKANALVAENLYRRLIADSRIELLDRARRAQALTGVTPDLSLSSPTLPRP